MKINKLKKLKLSLIISIAFTVITQQGFAMQPTHQNKLTTNASQQNPDEMGLVEPYNIHAFDEKIAEFYQSIASENTPSKRIKAAVTFFLGQPYSWEPLGEGDVGQYYQEPLYRTNRFDCVTFTDTILALAKSQNLSQFKLHILQIRYAKPEINYLYRTDWFTDLEWLPNAEKLGWLQDVTKNIVNQNGKPIALMASTIIDKPNWYKVRPMKSLRLLKPIPKEAATQLLSQLQSEGHVFQAKPSELSYLPLNVLFDSQGKPDAFLFNQIPSESVIVIVRPNWQIRDHLDGFPNGYGTNLNVSHLGVAIRTEEGLMFYHASSVEHKVVSLPLTEYLHHYLNSETIKGIHVEKIILNG